MEIMLTEPLTGVSASNTTAVRNALRDKAYQRITGVGFEWNFEADAGFRAFPHNQGAINQPVYHRIEMMMSDQTTSHPESWLLADVNIPQEPGAPRWLATLNPQASLFLRKPFVERSGVRSNFSPSYLVESYLKNTKTPTNNAKGLPDSHMGLVSAGPRVANPVPGQPQKLVIREFQTANTPLLSLGQLQHVNTSLLNLNPAYAIGNSHANLYVNRNSEFTTLNNEDTWATEDGIAAANPGNLPGGPVTGFPSKTTYNRIYDLSYLLNKTLWDSYFFSTIPTNLTASQTTEPNFHLPNARHTFYWNNTPPTDDADPRIAALKNHNLAAAFLRNNGGFNINSTSEQAWRAFLYRHNVDNTVLDEHPYSRFATALATSLNISRTKNEKWMGYRILTDDEISSLARNIVAEVRTRGPFLSLADFVNRRLTTDKNGLKGPLQAAIDASTVNSVTTSGSLNAATYPRDIKDPSGKNPDDLEQQIVYTGVVNAGNTAADATSAASSRAALAPGYLSQADLLTVIGSSITARSDTFRIRTYGDTKNAITGEIVSRAWCEAIVQRLPEYVIATADNPDRTPANLTNPINQQFGRRFKIIHFRWLSANEI
jgi:hypothetical protein